ncbi:MAG: hypothetical protein A2076_13580 [Geobacteraceae bacterium GWC2_53_11]|nr:MAG: hypothetical protein A2076_13580 [Geobacteraceae bacterium GWC2_53_11]
MKLMFGNCWRYLEALVLVAVALFLRMGIEILIGSELPTFITFFPVIMLASLVAGFGPGLLATVVSSIVVDVFIFTPGQFGHWNLGEAVSQILFIIFGICMSLVARRYLQMQQSMETLVGERTKALNENEARLRMAHQAANAGAWEWDIRTNKNYWSEELWRVYGLDPHSCEPSFEAWLQIIHPDDRVAVAQAVQAAAAAGSELSVEWRVCGSDGAVRWLMSRGQPKYDADGSFVRYVGIVMDITGRKQVEEEVLERDARLQVAYYQLQVTNIEQQAQSEELRERNEELALLWKQAQETEFLLRGSEDRFRDIVDVLADWIWEVDINSAYIFTSGRVKELLGYDPEELIGRTPFDLMPPDEAARARNEIQAVMARGESFRDFENVNIHKNGTFRYIQTSGVPIFDSQGNLWGYRGVDRDVTEQKLVERALQKNEERLRFHMENSPMAVIEWDNNFILTRWTGESERMFGWSAAEVLGKTLDSLNMVFEDDIPIVEETMARLTDGTSRHVIATNRNYTRSGAVRYCTWYNSVLVDAQGQMSSVMSKVIDISDRVEAEQRLDLLAETARRLLLSESPQDIVESLCTKVMSALGCDVFINFLGDEEQGRLYLNSCSGISAEEQQKIECLDFGVAICGCAARDACRVVAEDIPNNFDPRTELVKSFGVKAYACHPLMAQDRVLGTLSFGSRTRSFFPEDDLALMKAVADQVAMAIERMQSAQTLYKSNNELERRVVERTNELALSVTQLRDEISERVRAEKHLQRLNRLYAVLSETNQTIVRSTARESLFRDFCRIAVEHGGFLLAWVGLIDDQSGQLRNVASCGATGYLDDIRITVKDEPAGLGPTGISMREGTYAISNDFQHDAGTRSWHERGKAFGIQSSASIALKEEGTVIGALTLYSQEKNYFDEQHVSLLQQMGADVSFALDNMVREKRRLEAEQTLREETLQRLQAVESLRRQEHIMIQQNRQAAMGEMIGNIAHQWRQPLNTLGLLNQRLGFFYGSPNFNKEFLETSVSKSMELINYMSRTIDDFRTFFAADREMTTFQVNETVNKALSLVEASFKERRINMERDEAADVFINGYPNEYAQVLLNILINAKDAMIERNIESPWLKITVSSENGTSLVSIADNAGGIPEDIVEKIFDPYFTTKGPQQGTGVGLFMAKSIIENNMGGRLTVRNTDVGAEFLIEV